MCSQKFLFLFHKIWDIINDKDIMGEQTSHNIFFYASVPDFIGNIQH